MPRVGGAFRTLHTSVDAFAVDFGRPVFRSIGIEGKKVEPRRSIRLSGYVSFRALDGFQLRRSLTKQSLRISSARLPFPKSNRPGFRRARIPTTIPYLFGSW